MTECPNHQGAFDCTPFCSVCAGEQEYEGGVMEEQTEKARAFWAKVAKDNGWYAEPFFVQVWLSRETGELVDSVSTRALTEDVIVWEEPTCSYCQERPVFEHYNESCWKCSFTCMRCEELTPYEKGTSSDELCDDCGVLVGSTPENPWKRNGSGRNDV